MKLQNPVFRPESRVSLWRVMTNQQEERLKTQICEI